MSNPPTFPRAGQIWEVTHDCESQIQYLFSAPITFSASGKLAPGEQVRIAADMTDPEGIVVRFQPVRYEELHDRLVPADIREMPRYKQYLLSVKTEYFHEQFRLIDDGG